MTSIMEAELETEGQVGLCPLTRVPQISESQFPQLQNGDYGACQP